MDWNWLPLLILLICPLMMVFMMFGGHRHTHGKGNQKTQHSTLIELESKVTTLEKENEKLREEINELFSKK
ncbi:bZIP transcription factor [Ureibacillus acetophenoni]|uniref:DUF2933 family protein n=1 Tax=Ureibacillus acetophenoni TaxID=614649 RepID=A0A285URW7_9BACL|nr:bZIP transcription factor [Ureibacillus acetophenoni]SOC42981.1 hypothetical protein SAMN05877842_11423 [Ureibacillus acetophenoni]